MPETKRLKLLVLRITERCNLACDYCYAGKARGGDMPLSTALKAVEGAVGPGEAIKIQFTGGEPLLNAGIIEAVYDFGRDTGRRLKLAIQTNGTLLTIKNCLLLKKTGCSVGVSLDGTGEMNGRRRYPNGRQAFADACKGIMNLRDCGMMCALMSVVTSANAASLDRLLDLAFYLGNVYGVGLDIFRELGRGEGKAGELKASVDAFASGLDAMLLKHGEYAKKGINIHIRELDRYRRLMRRPAREAGGAYCYAQTESSQAVDPEGSLYPCSSLCFEKYRRGKVENIRDGAAESVAVKTMEPPGSCRNCEIFGYCRGGCPANGDKSLICVLNRKLYDYCLAIN